MAKPITVIMSVYNEQSAYLTASIDSILHQSYTNFEFIIMNDGSNFPHIAPILLQYAQQDDRIILLNNTTNLGLTAALNTALTQATGKYIARMDSDDIAHSTRLEKQFQFMEQHAQYALCGSWVLLINEHDLPTGEKKSPTTTEDIKKNLLWYNFFTHSSLFFRRETALLMHGYDPYFKKAQDYDFLLRISAKHPVAILPEFLLSLRLHQHSVSVRSKKVQEQYAIRARWNAIRNYGYPKIDAFKIIPSIIYFFLIPTCLKEKIFDILYKKK